MRIDPSKKQDTSSHDSQPPQPEETGVETAAIGQPPEADAPIDYKPSLYNHFVERGDIVWGANFRSRALARFSRDDYARVKELLNGAGAATTPDTLPEDSETLQELRAKLIKWQFLIPEQLDEITLLKMKNRTARFSSEVGVAFIIAPTLRCNFACGYCYVDRNASKMTEENRIRLGEFFHQKLPTSGSARVVWTGGDPSLAMDVIEDLSARFLASCQDKSSDYRATLITNGYLLDDKMVDSLRKSTIGRLQISLDGSREFHDTTRRLPKGKPTYDKILENIQRTCDEFKIAVRVNVDARNGHAIPDLIDDLEERGLKSKITIFFAQVDDVNENSAGYHDTCLPLDKYNQLECSIIELALDRGFSLGGRAFMRPVSTHCGANSVNCYVVDPQVNLLKCYHDLGAADKYGIGRIGEGGKEIITNHHHLLTWLDWDPFEIEECRNCDVLPLCMGGCGHKIMNSGFDMKRGCLKFRYSRDELIDVIGNAMVSKKTTIPCYSGCAG